VDADLARGNGAANPLHRLLKIRCMAQRRHADPEPLRGILRPGGTRQQLHKERPQETRFAVEQRSGGLRVPPPSLKRQGRAAAGWRCPAAGLSDCRNAPSRNGRARPSCAYARAPVHLSYARARAQRRKIRSKRLNFLNSASGMQRRAANGGRIGYFGHWRALKKQALADMGSCYVLFK